MLDRHSHAVRQLLHDIEVQIEGFHRSLERAGRTEQEHNVTRGQVKALRWVVKRIVGEPQQETEIDG